MNNSKTINDRTSVDKSYVNEIITLADKIDLSLSPEQIGTLLLHNTEDALRLCSWFKAEFDLMGDPQPNRSVK